ncbi:MAG: Gfo/Idh/MocA family oxidoreductase [Piscinibacter sp.]
MAIEGSKNKNGATMPARIRLGMVGGGEGAFIGAVHRIAARLDDHYEFVAGALSASPEKALRSGLAIGLAPERIYSDYAAMAKAEAARPDGIEAVAIVTPNHLHAPVAEAFLKAGIHVICDKPVTTTSKDARKLLALATKHKRVFAVTHNYTGYPMVRHARQMVHDGALGEIRVVQVEYPQDWLTEKLEATGQKQAEWRADPKRNGIGGAIADIGTHAHNLAAYITGLQIDELCAELSSFVKGRKLDDNAQVMLRYANGARGLLWASQVAPGNENNLRIRVYGSKGGIEWKQEHPNQLHWSPFGQATQIIARATGAANASAARVSRIPAGHPEGYLEGFATLYSEIAQAIRAARKGGAKADKAAHFPTLHDGIAGVAFIEAVVASSAKGGRWVRFKP